MNQPKFKFGETVMECGYLQTGIKPFKVERMEKWGDTFKIWTPDGRLSSEDNFEACISDIKKKLYAYKLLSNMIIFKSEECENSKGRRAPEYDIEYPLRSSEQDVKIGAVY